MRPRGEARGRRPYDLVRAAPEPEFEISVDGVAVPVVPGQSIGAALYGAGVRSWRTTRVGGRPRGLFCGIGVCFDCLVTVNDSPSLRACLTEARPGDRVSTGGAVRATGELQDEGSGA
ncbi:(2Fe-2S)-binding protein [Streptosporangium sp. NPDC051023]|uniref:(2Fe-2S)-binding protein n=1 Tax=Streptosporangium sp. NPDC051023 TaxID=3155410 RepID=UPI00344E1D48